MIHLDRDGLYSRADLAELLTPLGIDADFFIGRLKPRKVFRQAFLGADLLAAFATAPTLAGHGDEGDADKGADLPPAQNRGNRQRRGGKRTSPDALDRLLADLKGKRTGGEATAAKSMIERIKP